MRFSTIVAKGARPVVTAGSAVKGVGSTVASSVKDFGSEVKSEMSTLNEKARQRRLVKESLNAEIAKAKQVVNTTKAKA